MFDIFLFEMKSVNKVEQANKFAKAVFFDHSHEFMVGTKDEQDVASACKRLIQNTIICWNYMFMSQLIIDAQNEEAKKNQISIIRKKMAIAWQYIKLLVEYDYTDDKNERIVIFDPPKIRALKVS